MNVHDFSNENSVLHKFISELRDVQIQKDAMRFRRNIERVGEILSYELSKSLPYQAKEVQTQFGLKKTQLPSDEIIVCAVLRAGLPLHQGVLNYFDASENAFISAYRKHEDDADDFDVIVKYLASPSIEGKILILTDPMLATGKTLENVLEAFKNHGIPKQIHIISVIGSKNGVEYVSRIYPEQTQLWIATIDDSLSAKGYILPGLGDAGDLAYGEKL